MARSKAEKSNYGYFKVYYKGKQFYGKTLAEANAKRDAFMQKEQANNGQCARWHSPECSFHH